uniref:SH3 domain-containing protein n=1 Tax=Panagrolaimus sp. ES5 TaxID=591445 RepID=A0AC34F495_9BILA
MQSGIVPSIDQLKILRQNISRDERELSQLSAAQRQTKVLSVQNDERRSQLMGLQETYSQDEQQLRHAVDKVDSLKKQIELLYRRRASAASAAIAQQRQINAFSSSNNNISMNGPSPSSTPQITPQKQQHIISQSHLQQQQSQQFPHRPQASVVPFQIQKPMLNSSTDSEKITFDQLDHPPASGKRLPQRNIVIKRPDKPPPPPKRNSTTVAQYGSGDIRMMHNGIERPMPPAYSTIANSTTDYYKNFDQGALIHGRTDQLSLRNDSMKSLKRRSLLSQGDAPEVDIFRMLLEEQRKGKTHISFNDLHHELPLSVSQQPQQQAETTTTTTQNTMNVNGVTVNLRSHVIQQPRQIPPTMIVEESSAQTSQSAQMPVVASVKVSVSPQRSPIKEAKDYAETSINTDPSIAELEKPAIIEKEIIKKEEPKVIIEAVTAVDNNNTNNNNTNSIEVVTAEEEEEREEDEEAVLKRELEQLSIQEDDEPLSSLQEEFIQTLPLANEMPQIPAIIEIEIQEPEVAENENEEEVDVEYDDEDQNHHLMHHSNMHVVDPSESSSSSVDEEGSSSSEIPIILDESSLEEKAHLKGILRAPGKKKHNKRIVFDPFVLFLDGALEGQLDTVQENATKIDDVSKPNDEGITALHNAICACHYDIVKFLVDAGADVNALDSDGWSPLHCAASCNNLPMLKLLIQNGASIYATTLSDSETPIRKCEEKESGYEQCINYLSMCDAWAGIINDQKVYPFYPYEAENDDELSFNEGEILTVISRENHGEDRLWWLCESVQTKKRGFVPANFLGIYPTLKHSQNMIFKKFDIPSTPPPTTDSINNNSRIKNDEKILEQTSNFEKSLEISANA